MAKNDYKGKLLRLFREIMLLGKSPFGLSIKELEQKLDVSYRTIYRDLALLGQVGFYSEEITKGKYVIRGLDSDIHRFEKNLQFSAEEAGILASSLAAIPENHPLKKSVLQKMRAFSGMEDILKVIVKTDISRNIERLAQAIREKRQVTFHNYHSANSQSIRSRRVEPYAFSADGVFIKGFEHGQNVNKTYKLERIEEVALLKEEWKFEVFHEAETPPDIFGINSGQPWQLSLRMSMRAARLMKEEYPLSNKHIFKEDVSNWMFEGQVNSFIAVGRFIMGLIDEIEIVAPQELKDYILAKIK
ncbi:MAG TPA: WYL domain-containing transcriptional regulator, partial [Bacteroidetes bacterium]|nr:WYL domain-containing transcriptional regulator [Bacteroidota bacterium]